MNTSLRLFAALLSLTLSVQAAEITGPKGEIPSLSPGLPAAAPLHQPLAPGESISASSSLDIDIQPLAQIPSMSAASPVPEAAQPLHGSAPSVAAQAKSEIRVPERLAAQSRPSIGARFRELVSFFGLRGPEALVEAKDSLPEQILGAKPGDKPIFVKDKKGVDRLLSYDPNVKVARPDILKRLWATLTAVPRAIRDSREYRRRVNEEIKERVTDENLAWSLGRLELLATQEGILRAGNNELVNKWSIPKEQLNALSRADFAQSSLSAEELTFVFKTAMDLEEPTLQYQYAFAQSLHNRVPRMAHFLGTTLQERILQVALKGAAGKRSIWATEEVRHGPILERVHNMARDPSQPVVFQQGTAPRLPREGTDYVARSGMSNRSEAELAAASAYLTIKANTPKLSPTDVAMDGVFRDEVYHYVIMAALNKFVFGNHNRFYRLFKIARHELDFRPPQPNDRVKHRSRLPTFRVLYEIVYALNAIDKRVDKYLRGLDPESVKRIIGPYYRNDADIDAAVAAGEHNWTKMAVMEQNPDLSLEDVQRLEKRFGSDFLAVSRREIKASHIKGILDNYRQTSLRNPNYWARKKAFRQVDDMGLVLRRPLENSPGVMLELQFKVSGVEARVLTYVESDLREEILYAAKLDDLSLRQIGKLMDAEGVDFLSGFGDLKDLSTEELVAKLGGGGYARNPLRVVQDISQ